MYYVYLLRSIKNPNETYIGFTNNLAQRIKKHNEGGSVYTAELRPWKLITYIGFDDKFKAQEFEKYIKIGSGHAFAQKRLW